MILALQLVLAGVLATRRNPLAGVPSDALLLLPSTLASADELLIEGQPGSGAASDSARVELSKKDGTWVLPGYFNAPADAGKVTELLSRLGTIKRGLPIATTEAALRRFKLVDSDFERRLVFRRGGRTLSTLYVGSSPGLRKSDARTAADRAVYVVDLPTYELPTQASEWLNGDVLRGEADKLVELDVANAAHDNIQLRRPKAQESASASAGAGAGADSWTDPALAAGKQVDTSHADALARDVAQMRVDGVLGTEAKPGWQQDHPALTLKLQNDTAHSVDWTLSKPQSGDYYVLKSSAHPWFFSVNSSVAKQMIDASGHDALIVATKPPAKASGKT
ncbi:MAG TPA: DUF4340 domain-containing protein [Steroidobacteraceae bacterium]